MFLACTIALAPLAPVVAIAGFVPLLGCAGVTQIGLVDVQVIVTKLHEADANKDGALSIDELAAFTRDLRDLVK